MGSLTVDKKQRFFRIFCALRAERTAAMEIRKGSFLFQIAYGLTPKRQIPDQTNLCPFFWRLVLMMFLAWPFAIIVLVLVTACATILRTVAAIPMAVLFGLKLTSKPWGIDNGEFFAGEYAQIQRWPKWRGHRILPGAILIAGTVLFGAGWLVYAFPRTTGALLLLVGLFIGSVIFLDSQVWKITKEYIRAKTKKVCPAITFTD